MKIEVKKSSLESLKSETLVVFLSQKETKSKTKKATSSKSKSANTTTTVAIAEGVSKAILAKIQPAIDNGTFKATQNEALFFRDSGLTGAKHLLAIGLGSAKSLTAETLRQASATAVSTLKANKSKSASIAIDTLPHHSLSAETTLQSLTEGAVLTSYNFSEFKSQKSENDLESLDFVTSHSSKNHENGVANGSIIGESVNFARWLGDRPGNRMTPTILAEETVKAAKGTKLKVTTWDGARIKKEKMGSFLSVSLGSSQDPRFILMEYQGAPKSNKPVCFVGKGLTFDSGGISIKPSAGMEEMKYDMCGGAAVIGTMLAIAKLKLKINAIAFVPATENMPGPGANKPGDIVIARNGKSIEVNNTDAEGRLILADALAYACEQKPSIILDIATLTGAIVVALGNLHTGLFTRNDDLAEQIQKATKESGEWVWRMPLTDYHAKDIKGTYADLSNISSSKGAGSATAAAFLENFVDKDIPWAHFDIAGSGWHTGDRWPYCPRKGASGAMVRTFIEIAKSYE